MALQVRKHSAYMHSITAGGDILHVEGDRHFIGEDLIVDGDGVDRLDEAVGITRGASAQFKNCWFRNARKLVLCGSGNAEDKSLEHHKSVTFENCYFSNFGRRSPEVQDGMQVYLKNCVIENWGSPEYFSKRAFACRVDNESSLTVESCLFVQNCKWNFKTWLKDKAFHVSQAVADEGIRKLFSKKSYLCGLKRAVDCYYQDNVLFIGANFFCYRNELIHEGIESSLPHLTEMDLNEELFFFRTIYSDTKRYFQNLESRLRR